MEKNQLSQKGHINPQKKVEEILASIAQAEKLAAEPTLSEEDREKITDILVDDVEGFFSKSGAEEVSDWGGKMREIARRYPSMIVRREDPRKVMELVGEKRDLDIEFMKDAHGGEPYPNSALLGADLKGLKVPFERGFAKVESGASICIVGFNPGKDVKISDIPKDKYPHYNGDGEMKSKIRMVEGHVPQKDVKFVLYRLPRHMFPEDRMTAAEAENENLKHITRMFLLEN